MNASAGPTVRRILLGVQLRRMREAAGVSREDAGEAIRASGSKISRMELGQVSFKKRDVDDLLHLYGVLAEDERRGMLDMAAAANQRGWWHTYNDLLPRWFAPYVDLEQAASRIRTYEPQFVPGLLQTEQYARAVIRRGYSDAPRHEVERRIRLRMDRAKLLTEPHSPHLWAVVDEAALRRTIGGENVMRDQLNHLLSLAELSSLSLQVMPLHLGGHPAEGGAFSLLRFPDAALPDVVYVEQLTGALYLDDSPNVETYAQVMEQLCALAPLPGKSADIIERILAEA